MNNFRSQKSGYEGRRKKDERRSFIVSRLSSLVSRILILFFVLCFLSPICFAQESTLELTLDVNSNTVPLPCIFRPNIDLSGRGFHQDNSWPQTLAASEVLAAWQKEIGFNGIYRLQYNLWEICQLAKDNNAQNKLLANYENVIREITNSGGVVILDIFGTPAGLGKILDKKSAPRDLKTFKELVKRHIRNLSCDKKYNIWYEVWSAPDLDAFFLGREQEYFNLYKAVAEGIGELESETKIHIPIGGPGASWWFQNFDGNTIITPERSLIYELIKFCYSRRLPLDFITWHGYSTDDKVEKTDTNYKKMPVSLIRDWLDYFHFDANIPLIVDEWNYDSGANILPQRHRKSNVSASYILARMRNMYEAGVDHQLYFSLEDFQNNKEGVIRNVGIFWFLPDSLKYKGGAKSTFNVFKMLAGLGNNMFPSALKLSDEFIGAIAVKTEDGFKIIVYNYINSNIAMDFLSRNIAGLNDAERKFLLNLIKTNRLEKLLRKELDVSILRTTNKMRNLLKKAQELYEQSLKYAGSPRNLKIEIKNLKENYLYQRYSIDASCSLNCEFTPKEEETVIPGEYEKILAIEPYSVNMVVLKKKPPEIKNIVEETVVQPPVEKTEDEKQN